MTTIPEHRKLRLKRIDIGIRQYDMAERIGVTPYLLCRYERYGGPLPDAAVRKMKKILEGKK